MTLLQAILYLITALEHTACVVITSGAPDHAPRQIVFGGNCWEAVQYAQAIGNQATANLVQPFYPLLWG